MVNWACTQCGENLEAPDGFGEVIECPKCGNHSRPRTGPPPVQAKAKPNQDESISPDENKKASGLFRVLPTGKVLIVVGILVLWAALIEDTKSGDDDGGMVVAVIGAAILVAGVIFTTQDSSA